MENVDHCSLRRVTASETPKTNHSQNQHERAIDAAIVARVVAGETEQFNQLVLKYDSRIKRLIASWISNPGDRLDVVQETFIRAYRGLPNFRGDSAFYSWLHRIAINAARNYNERHFRKFPTGPELIEDTIVSHEATPEQSLMCEQTLQSIVDVLSVLPAEQRKALTLRDLKGFSYQEISRQMGCPVGTVRSRIFRARQAVIDKIYPPQVMSN